MLMLSDVFGQRLSMPSLASAGILSTHELHTGTGCCDAESKGSPGRGPAGDIPFLREEEYACVVWACICSLPAAFC